MKRLNQLRETPRTPGWLRLVLPFFGQSLYTVKFTLFFSALVTLAVFWGLSGIPLAFLTGLVTLDGLLIAVVGLVASVVLRVIGIEEVRETLGKSTTTTGIIGIASQLGLAGLYTIPVLLAMVAVVPFFIAAVLSLVGMLMARELAIYFGASAFWFTLSGFLGILSLAWHGINRIWDTQVPNLKKFFEMWSRRKK